MARPLAEGRRAAAAGRGAQRFRRPPGVRAAVDRPQAPCDPPQDGAAQEAGVGRPLRRRAFLAAGR
eukprot:4641119-Lingulodinium_polyedra.AAC.1